MIFITGGVFSGKTDYAKKHFPQRKIVGNINDIIRDAVKNGADAAEIIGKMIDSNADAVFISDEVGCGIVPIDKSERTLREEMGRINRMIAERSETAIRVVCGIGVVLK